MTTEYKLNQLIEWTAEHRAKGKCPVPDGSVVTVWLDDGTPTRTHFPEEWDWGDCELNIAGYLIHSVAREPIVRWILVDEGGSEAFFTEKSVADRWAKENGGRVVKMVEAQE